MRVQKRSRGGRTYYYLVHSVRDGPRVRKIERYIGTMAPKDLSKASAGLLKDLFAEEYLGNADSVGKAYRRVTRSTPLAVQRKNLEAFATRFTYDSNRIEGSTLTFRDTALLLEDGITPPDRPLSDVQEALAHREVFLEAINERGPLTLSMVLDWHRRMFEKTKPNLAGRIRLYPVRISRSRFVPPDPFELDRLLIEFFDWHRAARASVHPVLRAALVHLKLVSIHPFGDGNGRVTRIAMNRELRLARFPLFNVPYDGRRSYYTALERSQVGADEVPFIRWFMKRYLSQNTRAVAN